jgi:hypothetical protein
LKKISFLTLFVLMALSVSLAAAQDDDPCAQRGGTQNSDTGRCELNSSFEIDIQYPLEYTAYPNTQQTLDTFLQQTYQAFLQNIADMGLPTYTASYPWSLTVHYDEYQYSDTIISIAFNIYEFTGGAHGNTAWKTFTFDLAADTEITLDDVFLPDSDPFSIIVPLVQSDITTQLGDGADASWITDGTDQYPDEYLNFVLTQDELQFIFPPYQVAPYVNGTLVAHIPLTQLQPILAAPFAERG